MSVLVVNDRPIKSGYHYQILESIFEAHQCDFEVTHVFEGLSDKEIKKVKPEQWLAHSDELLAHAEGYDKILACGSIAPATIFKSDHSLPVTRVRGRGFIAPNGMYCVPTYNPMTCIKDTNFFRDLVFDVEKLLANDGPLPQPELEIVFIENRKDLSLLKDLHDASFLGMDTEATHLNPYYAELLAIGFAALTEDNNGYVIVIPYNLVGREVRSFLKNYKGIQVWHNFMYDVQLLWKKWGRFFPKQLADTMLMNWALDERPFNRYRSHGLDLLQRLYLDAPPKSVKMLDWLEEYFREDIGDQARWDWVENFCNEHAEMARTAWRQWYEEEHGEEPDWRGRKVGRDIEIMEVLAAVIEKRMPKAMQPPPDKERKAEMWDAMMRYMGEDAYSTARLFPILREKMDNESPHLWQAHQQFDLPASMAFGDIKLTGAPVNVRYLKRISKEITAELETEMKDIQAVVSELTTHDEMRKEGEDFNPNSSKQVTEVLYNAGDEGGLGLVMPKGVGRYAYKRDENKLTTNADTLKVLARQVARENPAAAKLINSILRYRVSSKILGTYVDGILDRVDPDGCIRGELNLHGTATARISASNPNLQNFPDASHVGYDVRASFAAPPGWTLLDADMSQLELRVAALFSQDEVMLEAYRGGADIHQEVAYLLWNKPKSQITKYERYLAKCMNFGVIYGRGARSIATGPEMDNLVEMSGRSWNNKEIDAYFAKFKKGYKDLFSWMELVKRDSLKKRYVESPTGHRRRFDLILPGERGHIERQMVNTPIQGFAARMVVHALVEIWKQFDPEKQRILFTVHDSILCMCKKNKATIAATKKIVKDTMENALPEVRMTLPTLKHAPFKMGDPLTYNLPFVADIAVGPNWSDCHEDSDHVVVPTGAQDEDLAHVA